jgi:hypothetical protein
MFILSQMSIFRKNYPAFHILLLINKIFKMIILLVTLPNDFNLPDNLQNIPINSKFIHSQRLSSDKKAAMPPLPKNKGMRPSETYIQTASCLLYI